MLEERGDRAWFWAMAAVVGAVQLGHLLVYGGDLLISPDSVAYIAVARNLVAGNGLITFDGLPLIFWPPLYSSLLASFLYLGIEPLSAAAFLNAVTFSLLALSCGYWLRSRTGSSVMGVIGVAVILVSRPLWYIHVFVWTEPLFALLCVLTLIVLQNYLDRGVVRLLLAAALLCGLACLVRYPGVFLIATGGLVLLFRGGVGWWRRIADGLVYGVIAVAPIFLWWWWSVGSTADPGGQRVAADRPFFQGLWDMTSTLTNWAIPWSIPTLPKLAILVAVALLVFLLLARRRTDAASPSTRAQSMGGFVLVYGGGVLILASLLSFDLLRDRILSPLYAPLAIWILIWGWNRFRSLPAGRWRRTVGATLLVLIAVWVGRSTLVTARMVDYEHRHAEDFSKPRWKESETLRFLAENPQDGLLFSNIPHVVYLYGRIHTRESPREHFFDSRQTKTDDLARFQEVLATEGEVRLLWFEIEPNDYFYDLPVLQQHFTMEPIHEFQDATLFRVTETAQ